MSRVARSGRAFGAVVMALALSAAAASPAVGDSATGVNADLTSVGCAADGTCWAVGVPTAGRGALLVPISSGKPGSPTRISDPTFGTSLGGVACESPTSCVAVGRQQYNSSVRGVVVPIVNGVPGSPQPVAGTSRLDAVTCPTSTRCLAVGAADTSFAPIAVPITGVTPGAAQTASGASPVIFASVACEDANHCVAVAQGSGGAAVEPITDGQPGAVQAVAAPNAGGELFLQGVACAAGTTSCLAVGGAAPARSEQYEGVAVPISNGTAGPLRMVAGTSRLDGVECTSAASCRAAGYSLSESGNVGKLVPTDVGGLAGAPKSEPGGGLSGIACWSAASCVAVGSGDVLLIGSATPSRAVVTAAVAKALAVTGRAARISAILHAGGYRARVSAPEAGKLTVTWYFLPRGAHLARAVKPIVVARGATTLPAAKSATLRLRLTSQGRALLKAAKQIKLTATGSFGPQTGATVTQRRSITLKTH